MSVSTTNYPTHPSYSGSFQDFANERNISTFACAILGIGICYFAPFTFTATLLVASTFAISFAICILFTSSEDISDMRVSEPKLTLSRQFGDDSDDDVDDKAPVAQDQDDFDHDDSDDDGTGKLKK